MSMNDIIVTNNFDESRNERIIIIYGKSSNDNRNGQIDIISSAKENTYYHALYFKAHAKKNYIEDDQYQGFIETASNTMNTGAIIFLQNVKYNNIIFTETTQENSKERYGAIFFPAQSPSDEQYQSLEILKKKLINFEKILVCGAPYAENGFLDSKIMFELSNSEIIDLDKRIKEAYKSLEINKPPINKR